MKARLIPETGPYPKVRYMKFHQSDYPHYTALLFITAPLKLGLFLCEGRTDFCRDTKFFQDSEKSMGHLSFLSDILAFIFNPNKFLQDLSHQTLV